MTKSKESKPKAPALKDILAEQLKAEQAAQEAAAEAQAKAEAAREAAKAALDEAMSGKRSERDALLAKVNEAFAAAEAIKEEAAEQLRALEAAVEEEFGIPAALFNADIAATMQTSKKGKSTRESGRTRATTADIGVVGPVVVTAPYRANRTDEMKFISIQYAIRENDAKLGPELVAVRVKDGTAPSDQFEYTHSSYVEQGGYTHNRPSAATTQPGWHETDDVLYALAIAAGKVPTRKSSNDPSLISINGKPIAEAEKVAEPITETV